MFRIHIRVGTLSRNPSQSPSPGVVHTIQFTPDPVGGWGSCGFNPEPYVTCGVHFNWMTYWWGRPPIPGFDATLGDLSSVTFDTTITIAFQSDYHVSWNSELPPPGTRAEVSASFGLGLVSGPVSEAPGASEKLAQLRELSQLGQQSQPECEPPCQLDWLLESSSQSVFDDDLERFIGPEPFFVDYYGTSYAFGSAGHYFPALEFSPSVSIVTTYSYTPAPIAVEIDIKPGSDLNPINPMSRGVIPVAILGSDTFACSTWT